jgi:hypothetical protein
MRNIAREWNERAARMGTNRQCSARQTSCWERETPVDDANDREAPWEDAIVAEVRAVRVALLAAAGYDLDRLAERLRQEQVSSGHSVVTFPPRAPGPTTGEAA